MKLKKRNTISLRHKRHSVSHALASAVYSALAGPLSASLRSNLERGEYRSIIEAEINPSDYSSLEDFADDYLAVELMSKYPEWDVGIDRDKVAVAKFLASEEACREANKRLARLPVMELTTITRGSYIHTARRKIADLLGPFDWDEAREYFGFGPGATFQLPRVKSDPLYKFGLTQADVTSSCALLAACVIVQIPIWLKQLTGLSPAEAEELGMSEVVSRAFQIVPGNRITTVPKNSKTNRIIAIEPTMNGYIQKGIGGSIRRRLRRAGVDLNDQSLNQRLAHDGSVTGLLATMDLSAASDSVSMELVEQLLPEDWVTAIKLSRSSLGVLPDGTQVRYQKVSSMGNGFTFELESLIFWALVRSVMDYDHGGLDRRLGVYGDDLIFPVHLFAQVEDLLGYCGFAVNRKKSFCYGYFRESCGKHYFNGVDVTPIYIREDVKHIDTLLLQANNLRRYSSRGRGWTSRGNPAQPGWGTRSEFKIAYDLVVEQLPPVLRRPRIPDGYGDLALIGDFDEVRPSKAPRGLEGWMCRGFTLAGGLRTVESSGDAIVLKALNRLEGRREVCSPLDKNYARTALGDPAKVRFELAHLKPHKLLVHRWDNLGPWSG